MEDRHISVVADAMEFMKELPEEFDIIILDPPAFAKHLDKKHKAVQGYKRLNAHALRQIKSGGILITFSCSQVIDKSLFNHTIISAAIESNRKVKILYQLHQQHHNVHMMDFLNILLIFDLNHLLYHKIDYI